MTHTANQVRFAMPVLTPMEQMERLVPPAIRVIQRLQRSSNINRMQRLIDHELRMQRLFDREWRMARRSRFFFPCTDDPSQVSTIDRDEAVQAPQKQDSVALAGSFLVAG
ncbi:MAG: hypothetical protein OXC18_18515 [Desulfurellaceae bacterium]|nr:hypothetical protein [Desulfurellaceae bacterium]